ncbi:MAG: H/ACA ribonucleoprotein complex subunit GAR1 [Archaeoglobaceae archaeon]
MKDLRKIGSVAHVSRSGFIVSPLEPNNLPDIGSEVVNNRAKKIGSVYDIIGPTRSPFALIKPQKEALKAPGKSGAVSLTEEELFVVIAHAGNRKSKGKRKRSREKRN